MSDLSDFLYDNGLVENVADFYDPYVDENDELSNNHESNKNIDDRESRARKRKASENSNVVPSNPLKVKVVNDKNVNDIQELKALRNVKRFQVKRKKKRGGKKK